jgi:diamine N-acetyltransferase
MQNLDNIHIRLRALEPEDLETLYAWENDMSIWHLSNTLIPFSKSTLKQYLKNSKLDIFEAKQLRLIIELKYDSRPVGAIDLFDFDPFHLRAGIGILISNKNDRQQGYASEALQTLIAYSFTVLGLKQLFCTITEDNQQSLRLFIKNGFVITGQKTDWIKKGDEWLTEYFLQLIRK